MQLCVATVSAQRREVKIDIRYMFFKASLVIFIAAPGAWDWSRNAAALVGAVLAMEQ